jgi:hypothetical protein
LLTDPVVHRSYKASKKNTVFGAHGRYDDLDGERPRVLDAGHFALDGKPDQIIRLVRDFMDQAANQIVRNQGTSFLGASIHFMPRCHLSKFPFYPIFLFVMAGLAGGMLVGCAPFASVAVVVPPSP